MNNSNNNSDFNDVLCGMIATLMAGLVWLFTWGTVAGSDRTLAILVGLSWLLMSGSLFLCNRIGCASETLVAVAILVLMCIAGVTLTEGIMAWFTPTMSLIGLLVFGLRLVSFFRQASAYQVLITVAFAVLYCSVMVNYCWYAEDGNPLWIYAASQGTAGNVDHLFHSAVATGIQIHYTSSVCIDGSPYVHYHWGSHAIIAALSSLSGLLPIDFYAIGLPVVLLPFSVWCFLGFIIAVSKQLVARVGNSDLSNTVHLVLIVCLSGWILDVLWPHTNHSRWDRNIMISESQLIGLALFAAAATSFLPFFVKCLNSGDSVNGRLLWLGHTFAWCVSLAVLSLIKVSIGHVIVCVVAAFSILGRNRNLVIILAASVIVVAAISPIVINSSGDSGVVFSPISFAHRTFLSAYGLQYGIVVFVFPVVYTYLRLRQLDVSMAGLCDLWKEKKALDIPALWSLMLAGIAPMLLLDGPMAHNTLYYQSTATMGALLCLCGLIDGSERQGLNVSWVSRPAATLVVSMVLVSVVIGISPKLVENVISKLRWNLSSRGGLVATPLGQEPENGKLQLRSVLRSGDFQRFVDLVKQNTEKTEESFRVGGPAVLHTLWQLGQQSSLAERRTKVIWIPKENRDFWEQFPDNVHGVRAFASFAAVSLSGMVMIDGYPEVNRVAGYGWDAYPVREKSADGSLDLSGAISRAGILGYSTLLEIKAGGTVVAHSVSSK